MQEGIALPPVNIDAVKLLGYGFPRHRGGPMHFADQAGLDKLIGDIKHYATEDAYFWQVPSLIFGSAGVGNDGLLALSQLSL